jgi:hypothetical protein
MDVLTYYLDDTAPAIRRRLAVQDEGDVDLTVGPTFRLKVRALWSDVLVINASMTVDIDADELIYQPQADDFSDEGVYRAWITVDYGGGLVQNTDEFQINVFAHGPGQGMPVGAVYRAARALEPVAWDSLKAYPDYGDPELQRVIDLAKLRVLPAPATALQESSLDPRIIDYIAKKALVDNVLYAAISFWSNQFIQQTARGNTEEVATYPDRIGTVESAIDRYREDLVRQLPEVDAIIGSVGNQYDAPALNDSGPLLTPGLDEYPALPVTLPYGGRGGIWRGTR